MNPTVSLLIPTYNRRSLLARALSSVKGQTFASFEALVLNDGGESVDDIVCALDDPRFVSVPFSTNRGKAALLNDGLARARGAYIGYLDDDDEYLPFHLERLMSAIRETMGARWAYADTVIRYQCREDDVTVFEELENDLDVGPAMLYWRNYVNHKNILHERILALEVGGYSPDAEVYIDWEMALAMSLRSRPVHVKEVTSIYYRSLYASDNKTTLAHASATGHDRRVLEVRSLAANSIAQTIPHALHVVAGGAGAESSADRLRSVCRSKPLSVWAAPDTKKNIGAMFNKGTKGSDAPLLLFIRGDVTVIPGWIEAAVKYLTADSSLGMVTALELDRNGFRVRHAGLFSDDDGNPLSPFEWENGANTLFEELGDLMGSLSSAIMTTRSLFDEIGGFDENLATLSAYLDFSQRVRRAGKRIRLAPLSGVCVSNPEAPLPSNELRSVAPDFRFDRPEPLPAAVTGINPFLSRQRGLIHSAHGFPLLNHLTKRPYRLIDPGLVFDTLARAERPHIVATARFENVALVGQKIVERRPPGASAPSLLANRHVALRYADEPWVGEMFVTDAPRIHLSLIEKELADRLTECNCDVAIVMMNNDSFRSYAHVFALMELIGIRTVFAVLPFFHLAKIEMDRIRVAFAHYNIELSI